jgi:hypothetical protein
LGAFPNLRVGSVSRKYLEGLETSLATNLHRNTGNVAPNRSPGTSGATDEKCGGPKPRTRKNRKNTSGHKDEAEELGMIANWSHAFGYVSIRDPEDDTWHDLAVADAPGWALSEARKRKELYKGGEFRAYRLTSRQMEEIWEAEHPVEEEGIVEEYPIEDEAG